MNLPDWIPVDAWAGYVEMRKKIRKPMTDRAVALAVGTLSKLAEQGQDVGAVLDQSTLNSWQGLFPLRDVTVTRQNVTQNAPAMSRLGKAGQATANNAQDWLEGN